MSAIAQNKKIARKFWRSQNLPTPDWVKANSRKIVDFIVSSPEFKAAGQVSSFSALPWEPDLTEVWKSAPQKVVYPKIDIKKDRIDFFSINRWEDLTPGRSDIMEPPATRPAAMWKAGDIILVPALAFDKNLNRLGSGKGYYDKFLSSIPREVLRWGVIFHDRISDLELPTDSFDQKVDRIISEKVPRP